MARRAHVYRNIDQRSDFFGLELADLFVSAVAGWLASMIGGSSVSAPVFAFGGAVLTLRFLKLGAPPGYTTALAKFMCRPAHFSAAAPDAELAARPFPHRSAS